MKSKILVGGFVAGMLLSATPVMAKGNATVEFTGDNTVSVGDTFKVYMNVLDVVDTYDGVVSLGGNIEFDETKLEYVSSKGVDSPYLFQINEDANYKIAGLDFTLDNGIREDSIVYEFTFRAIDEGNASVTITNAKLTDSQDYISTNVISKEINITEKEVKSVKNENAEIKENVNKEQKTTETKVETTIEKTSIQKDKKVQNTKTIVAEKTDDNKVENVIALEAKEIFSSKLNVFEKINTYVNELVTKIFKFFR